MAALEQVLDQNEAFLDGLGDVEWIDDVTAYKCARCQKVLVQHYIANCEHKFCKNCTRLVDDGSQRWRCPRCNEFIKEIGRQDFEFRDRVNELRMHCPNRKYGCDHICPFMQLKEHLDGCAHTRESILPVLYTGEPMPDMLVELHQLRWEVKEMRQKMMEMEKMCVEREVDAEQKGVNESAWELNIIMNEMKREMEEMRNEHKERKIKLKTKLFLINNRVDGVKSDLIVEKSRLSNEIKDIRDSVSLAVEENKGRILKLKGKADACNEMTEFNNRKNAELMRQLKSDVEQTMDERIKVAKAENDKKMAEMIKELSFENTQKIEINAKLKSIKAEIETFKIYNKKENVEEINRKISVFKREINEKNDKIAQRIDVMEQEMATKIKENKIDADEKLREFVVPLSVKFDAKIQENESRMRNELQSKEIKSENKMELLKQTMNEMEKETNDRMTHLVRFMKQKMDTMATNLEGKVQQLSSIDVSECKTEIARVEQKTRQNQFRMQFNNKSTELISLEQNGFNLERFTQLRFSQMNVFTLAENKGNFQPAFTWKISGIRDKMQRKGFEITSAVFECTGYSIQARAKMNLKLFSDVHVSLCLEKAGKLLDLHVIPHVYYVIRDRANTRDPKHICDTRSYVFNTKFDRSLDFEAPLSRKSTLLDPAYNVDDSVVMDIYVEPPTMAKQAYSFDGVLNWAIDDFQKRKRMLKEEVVEYHESPYFYTGPKGYRVQVEMWLRDGLLAYVYFLPGEFDLDLPGTFAHQTTITLFNRKDPQKNIVKTVDKDLKNYKLYSVDICNDNVIEDFLLNDTLFYKVAVKPSN